MKRSIMFFLVSILCNAFVIAQVPGNTTLSAGGTSILKETIGQTTTYGYGSYGIGMEIVGSTTKVYRTYFDFSLEAIPTNATIQKVTVYISNGKNGYTQKLTQIASLNPSDLNSSWTAIGNGSSLHTGLAYNASSFTSTAIKTAIQGSLSGRKVIIGALSESESTNGSNSSVSLSLYVEYTRPLATINYSVYNNMDGYTGGHVGAGIGSATDRTSPFSNTATEAQTLYVQAYDTGNSTGGYNYVFNDNEATNYKSNIEKYGGSGNVSFGNNPSPTHTFLQNDSGSEFVVNLRKVCNLSFSNRGHLINLNGSNYTTSVSTTSIVQNTVDVYAEGYFITDYIEHSYQGGWRNSAGQLISSTTITASQNDTYTPEYRVQALIPDVTFGNTIGQPIQINWTDNPNTAVTQYRVYRKVFSNGSWSSDQLLATVNRGTQTYTDYDYNLATWRTGTWLQYGLTAYYTGTSAWSTGGANTYVYGTGGASMQENNLALKEIEGEIPLEFGLSNYPNPFNPTTTINYQLPKDGMVTIKVYDIIGKEVATLVNEAKSVGYYKVDFDASKLTSGVYICSIQASGFNKSIKLLLTK